MSDHALVGTTPRPAPRPGGVEDGPRHVAILMHGSSRWAEQRGLPRLAGYEAAARNAARALRTLRELGIGHVTLSAPDLAERSSESPDDPLSQVLVRVLERDEALLRELDLRVRVIGDLDALPTRGRRAVEGLVGATREGGGMTVWLALSYGARRDLADAMRALAARVRVGLLLPEELDLAALRGSLTTAEMPDADLVLRTGSAPLGDFLLLESAGAELFEVDAAWPEVEPELLREAVRHFARRRARALGRAA